MSIEGDMMRDREACLEQEQRDRDAPTALTVPLRVAEEIELILGAAFILRGQTGEPIWATQFRQELRSSRRKAAS